MATYKTPDVYVEEISVFPPSVAEVATAIPVFIGYTEKAEYNGTDLKNRPTRINSMIEYHERFGMDATFKISKIILDEKNMVAKNGVKRDQKYHLYDSLQLFFLNGGSTCYIVSVGFYDGNKIEKDKLMEGLGKAGKEDEVTLILFPDAVNLKDNGLYSLQQAALSQCNNLMDRFVIMDLYESKEDKENFYWENGVDEFRDKIGINYLKYGAAYTPYLVSAIEKKVSFEMINENLEKSDKKCSFKDINQDNVVAQILTHLKEAMEDREKIAHEGKNTIQEFLKSKSLKDLIPKQTDCKTLMEGYNEIINNKDNEGKKDKWNIINKNVVDYMFMILKEIIAKWGVKIDSSESVLTKEMSQYVRDQMKVFLSEVVKIKEFDIKMCVSPPGGYQLTDRSLKDIAKDIAKEIKDEKISNEVIKNLNELKDEVLSEEEFTRSLKKKIGKNKNFDKYKDLILKHASYAKDFKTDLTNCADQIKKVIDEQGRNKKDPEIEKIFLSLLERIKNIKNASETNCKNLEESLKKSSLLYNNILTQVKKSLQIVPPSGAIAGVYAAVDNDRGVWKAPANVSLSSINDLTRHIDNKQQENLNINVTAGKSINAIRPFLGKGVLVWGGRTLMGNDNEWRYISVRRFFNMVEESVKKSTYWAVFEPNDANLWVKVKGIIENYLMQKWKEGALTGAIPDQAFYVRVGLGQTMSAQDILEGRLIFDIGLAVVRPAEFIILRFMHKMQES